jgi:hypothetical protein
VAIAFTERVGTPSTANATSYASGSFTPAVGDLLIVMCSVSGSATTGSITCTNSQSIAFTRINATSKASAADTLAVFVATTTVASAVSQT